MKKDLITAHVAQAGSLLCRRLPICVPRKTSKRINNTFHERPRNHARISPCTLRLLTPALLTHSLPLVRPSRACGFAHIPFAASQAAQVSFSEEREEAAATFMVQVQCANRSEILTPAECHSAIQQATSLRYSPDSTLPLSTF